MAARPGTRAQLKDALETIDALREQLGSQLNPDPEATFLALGQEVRDAMAVRALFMHSADMYAALRQLGFDTKDRSIAELRVMAKQVFDTPGVRTKLTANLEDFEGQRLAMIARQVQIALHGTDENSTRAFATLARVLGWQKSPDTVINNDRRQVNVWQLYDSADKAAKPVEQTTPVGGGLLALSHEPGDPTKIDNSEDLPEGVIVHDDSDDE